MPKEEINKKEIEEPAPPVIEEGKEKKTEIKADTKDSAPPPPVIEEDEEKEMAEKEIALKAEKEAKAKADKKKANKKRTKKKKVVKKTEHTPKRIRILMSLANAERAYTPGQSYEVGKDVSVESARNYLKNGLAEVDASIEGPSETK